jgi:hypothetical protein
MRKRALLLFIVGLFCLPLAVLNTDKARAAISTLTGEEASTSNNTLMNENGRQYARGRGGGRSRGGSRNRGGSRKVNRGGNRNHNANRNTNRNRNVNRNTNRNRNVNRNVNVNVRHRGRGWRGARWGAVAFGVTMGAVIVVVANTPPYPPDPSLCWTWNNSALTRGYWYYCNGN